VKDAGLELKALKQEIAQSKTEATKILGKISGEFVQLEALMKSKASKELPEVCITKTNATFQTMKDTMAECKSVLGKGGKLTTTYNDATNLAKQSALQRNFVSQLTQTTMLTNMP
jgi:hypothetical protein